MPREPIELFDIALDEVSLVDKGDCPEAHVVFFKRDSGRIDKARFNEYLRARLADHVLSEIKRLADTLGDAVAATIFNNEGAAAVRENLSEFSEAVNTVIDRWAAEPGMVEKIDRTKRVLSEDITSLAMRAMSEVLGRRPVRKRSDREESMTTTFSKRSDALEAATREAEGLMRRNPDKYGGNIAAARADVWKLRSDLADAYASLPPEPVEKAHSSNTTARSEGTAGRDTAPVQEGATVISVLNEISEEARKLIATGQFSSLQVARAEAWRRRPDLARRYQEANAATG